MSLFQITDREADKIIISTILGGQNGGKMFSSVFRSSIQPRFPIDVYDRIIQRVNKLLDLKVLVMSHNVFKQMTLTVPGLALLIKDDNNKRFTNRLS